MILLLGALASVAFGLSQFRLALTPARPPALRRVSLWAACAWLCMAIAFAAGRLHGPPVTLAASIGALLFTLLWLTAAWALSKQNTTM